MTKRDIPSSYAGAERLLGKREYRACGYATALQRRPDGIGLVHHHTTIVVFHPDGTATFNTRGYHTVSTKSRLNLVLRESPWRIWSERGEMRWYYTHSNFKRDHIEYRDGDRVFLCRGKGAAILEDFGQ